jgi:hypothetical protein
MAYDVFISYRRKGAGAGVAGELQAKLEQRGYKVFLDVDNIGSGAFPAQIENAIKECRDFLLILSPGMLDRCSDENDWVRREILLAEQYDKNIIGVSLPGFVMPEPELLPAPLRDLPQKQVFLWSHEYRNASINKIEENLLAARQKKKKHRTRLIAVASTVLAVLVVGLSLLLANRPAVAEEPSEEDNALARERSVRASFSEWLEKGDGLLQRVPNPTTPEDFAAFMEAVACFDSAQSMVVQYPEYAMDSIHLAGKVDSLERLRKDRIATELDATTKFLDVDQMDFAQYRFNNAKVLARAADQTKMESIARRLHD